MREKGQTEVAKTLETPVFSRGIEILTEKIRFVKNVQGRGCFVMGRGSELMREQLICKVENGLTDAIKAARIANLPNEELHRLLDILLEANTDD